MRKTLYMLVSAMSIGFVGCPNNNPANKFLQSLQQDSPPELVDNKTGDDTSKQKGAKADNLEKIVEEKKEKVKTVERETEANEQQKIPYKVYSKEEFTSIDQIIAEHKKTFESAGNRGEALKWLNYALDEAKAAKRWGSIGISISIAKEKSGYVRDALCNPEEIIKEVYTNFIRIEGPRRVREYLEDAQKNAKSGELWREVVWDLSMAEEYAKEAGIKLDEKEKRDIKELYTRGIKENGPKKAAKYLREAADTLEKCGSVNDIQWSINRARDYAKEAGFELIGEK